jgi:hypothetical protein
MDEIFELLVSILLGVILYKVNEIYKRPPVLISCECFNDICHDEMKEIRDLYMSKKAHEEQAEGSHSSQRQEKEVDDLVSTEDEAADGEKVEKEE